VGDGPGSGCGSCAGDVGAVVLVVQKGGKHGSVGKTKGGGVVVVTGGAVVVGTVLVGVGVGVDGGCCTLERGTQV